MTARSRAARVVGAAAMLAFAACSDGTGPRFEAFDPAHADADLDAMATVFSSPALQSFTSLSAYFSVGSASAAVSSAAALVDVPRPSAASARVVAERAARDLLSGAMAGAMAGPRPSLEVLPAGILGTTFEFDDQSQQYVASNRAGAPVNGVRFVLYAVDPITRAPITSTETGHVDLIDTSAGSQSTIGLRLLVVSGGTTYLDYAFSAFGTANSAQLSVEGFLTDGTTRLNFDIGARFAAVTEQFTLDVDFTFDVPSRDFRIAGSVDGASGATSGSGQIVLTISSGGASVRYVIDGDDATVNATIYVNNRIFATITGDPDSPTIAGAGGAELTTDEQAILMRMLGVADDVFEFFGELLSPLDGVGAAIP